MTPGKNKINVSEALKLRLHNKLTFFKGSHKAGINEEKPKTIEVLYCNFKPAGRTRSLFEGMNL